MTNIETIVTRLYRLAISLLVLLYAPAAFAQTGEVESTGEGITSFLFSTRSVTVILVLSLVAQIVYRQVARKASKEVAVAYVQQESLEEKKRYDKEEMSKLLKASATAPKNGGRTLEEAIRLSQMLQPALPSDSKAQESVEQPDALHAAAIEVDESEDSVVAEPDFVEVEPVVEPQVRSVETEDAEQV